MNKGRPYMQLREKIECSNVTRTSRRRKRPKKTWIETIRNDLKALNLTGKIALNRAEWLQRKVHAS